MTREFLDRLKEYLDCRDRTACARLLGQDVGACEGLEAAALEQMRALFPDDTEWRQMPDGTWRHRSQG